MRALQKGRQQTALHYFFDACNVLFTRKRLYVAKFTCRRGWCSDGSASWLLQLQQQCVIEFEIQKNVVAQSTEEVDAGLDLAQGPIGHWGSPA
jgi:hypothetical protein